MYTSMDTNIYIGYLCIYIYMEIISIIPSVLLLLLLLLLLPGQDSASRTRAKEGHSVRLASGRLRLRAGARIPGLGRHDVYAY